MNEQRSSLAGVCIQQQSSEQRGLIVEQHNRDSSSTSDGGITVSNVFQTSKYTTSAGTAARGGGMSGGVASQPPQLHRSLLANGVPYSTYSLLKGWLTKCHLIVLLSERVLYLECFYFFYFYLF